MAVGQAWWETAFAGHYRAIYAHRDDHAAAAEAAALAEQLRGIPGPVLDVGCGHGRHLVALRRQGIAAWGLDFSAALLADAQRRQACRGRLLRGDMRRPPVGSGWGAVLMLFTVFGYFDDETNRACLAAWARTLAPGGRLVIDLPEPRHLAATLCPVSRRRGSDGLEVCENRRIVDDRIEKEVVLRHGDAELLRYTESVRLYDRAEFTDMAHQAGLDVHMVWPGLCGAGHDDHRLVWWLAPRNAVHHGDTETRRRERQREKGL
jgi:SAM-dependent methyltransferase